ncbi:MAG: hypothetical protein B6D59_03205 [Campylobacteraceae bacterium 4484_4]|nr:MAG: hypothetical protein B6D59_03205 [Campylobacteraceae bacterium 4484_4]
MAFFVTLFISLSFPPLLSAQFHYEGDGIIMDKTLKKMKEMGDELYEKTGISTAIIAKKHLDKDEFLKLKEYYQKKLNPPYVLWIFSKTYMDRKDIGINQMFHSPDLDGKYDEDALFSPFRGSFTKLIVVKKSKSDITSAAFLNGFADLVDMLAKSYGVTLKSSVGSQNRTTIDIFRILFYGMILFFLFLYFKKRFRKRKKQ